MVISQYHTTELTNDTCKCDSVDRASTRIRTRIVRIPKTSEIPLQRYFVKIVIINAIGTNILCNEKWRHKRPNLIEKRIKDFPSNLRVNEEKKNTRRFKELREFPRGRWFYVKADGGMDNDNSIEEQSLRTFQVLQRYLSQEPQSRMQMK